MDIKQLLLSKFIFQKGERFLKKEDPMSCGLAVSLFKDSAELLLWTIAKEFNAAVKGRETFEGLWKKINKVNEDESREALPFKAKMIELNKSRVNFKNYGNLPNPADAFRFVEYTEQFLREL